MSIAASESAETPVSTPTSTPISDHHDLAPPESMARATSVIALGNIASRVLGLVREMILSNLFGAGAAVDAFNLAIIVPRSLYDLLIGGHVNSALVPVLSEYAARDDKRDLWDLVNALMTLAVIVLSALIIVVEIFASDMIRAFPSSKDATPEVIAEAVDLLRITAPALLFLSLFAVLSGLLYALRRFTWPAFASTVFNGTIVLITLVFAGRIGITAAALGWLIGAVVQLLLQAPGLRDARLGFKLRGVLHHPGVRRIGWLYLPVMASLGLDVLINRPFSYNLALGTGEGSISYMNWATTLLQFPQGLIAIAISAAILPTLSRQGINAADQVLGGFKTTLGQGLRLTIVLIIPAAVGLFVLAEPVVSLLFEHGEFYAVDTDFTALALRLYLLGLPFAAVDLLLVFAFYARQNTITPAVIGLISLIAYMVVAVYLLRWYSFFALMIADSVKHLVHTGVSAWLLGRGIEGYGDQRLIRTIARTSFAAVCMGLIAFGVMALLTMGLPDGLNRTLTQLIIVSTAGGIGVVAFGVMASLLKLDEWRWLLDLARQRLGI